MATATTDESMAAQINDMLVANNVVSDVPSTTETTTTDPATTEEVVIDPVADPALAAAEEVPTATTAAPSLEDTPVATELEASHAAALAKIEELSSQLLALQTAQANGAASAPMAAPANFVTQEDIDNGVFATPESFNALLAKVAAHAEEEALRRSVAVTSKIVRQNTELTMMHERFYEANKDLRPYKAIVGRVANALVAADPNLAKNLTELLPLAAKQARAEINLIASQVKAAGGDTRIPASPRPPAATQHAPAEDPNSLRSQLDQMLLANKVPIGDLLS